MFRISTFGRRSSFYTLSGPSRPVARCGGDVLTSGRFLTFETENLLQLDDKAVIPVGCCTSSGRIEKATGWLADAGVAG